VKVVVAHDYITQRGGAERVVLEIANAFPGSSVLTSTYVPEQTYPDFADLTVHSFGLERFKPIARDPRLALPALGDLFRRHVVDADLVICSSSGFAHQIRSRGAKIVYCHNPPRWLHQWEDYSIGLGWHERLALKVMRPHLRKLDIQGARGATAYLANSNNVAWRISEAYGIAAEVVHPARGLDPGQGAAPVPGLPPGFLLTVGRPRGYKRTDLLLEAVAGMPEQVLVTVGNPPDPRWPANIKQFVDVSDAELRWLYQSASGLLACSREDFGLTPVEAFAFGTPVGATREGGYLETCVDGLTGVWIDTESTSSMQASIRRLVSQHWDHEAIRKHGEEWSSAAFRKRLVNVVGRILEP
jgi:glycosyltransferase involved in cell wall biosynthesis